MSASEGADIARLNSLLGKWREPGLVRVRSQDIIPDATNRENMGLSLEHTHLIAASIDRDGFRPREGTTGHDVPVLVRETTTSVLGSHSLAKWQERVRETPGFPPIEISEAELFTSLGNGHFSQALNLFRCEMRSILTGQRLQVGRDSNLAKAINQGVASIVLRGCTPRSERKAISLLLNKLHHVRWDLGDDGELHLTADAQQQNHKPTQFEAMSKVMDAEELSVLVRTKYGIDVEEAQTGYRSRL